VESITDREHRRRDFGYDELGRKLTETWYNDTPAVVGRITFTYDAPWAGPSPAANDSGTYTIDVRLQGASRDGEGSVGQRAHLYL
jgi:hypothetical protein